MDPTKRRILPPLLQNQIFEMLQDAGLESAEFKWVVVRGDRAHLDVSLITHERTGFFFLFDVGASGYYPKSWPAHPEFEQLQPKQVMDLAQLWIQTIAPELKAPDLWKLASEQRRIVSDPATGNAPFSDDEHQQLERGLFELEQFVYQSEPTLSPQNRMTVSARFAYLKEAAGRVGRIDWTTMVVGQLFSMTSERLLTVETFRGAYAIAAQMFASTLSGIQEAASRLLEG